MKERRGQNPIERRRTEEALYRTILTLRNVEECRLFFTDLCTPAELEAMADRWCVVEHLARGQSYRLINEETGISVTTIGRVARYLTQGSGGYRRALNHLGLAQK